MTQSPEKNPYRPGAALPPLFLAGRARELARFRSVLNGAPELPANIRLTGLRGVGKTVLLKKFESIAQEMDWMVVREQVEPRHNREEELTGFLVGLANQVETRASRSARVREMAKGAAAAVSRVLKITYADIEFSIDPIGGNRQRSLVKAFFTAAEAAWNNGFGGFLLLLDEAQILRDEKSRDGEHPLSLLIATVNTLQDKGVPIGVVVCGLPTLRSNLLKARTYTERMFRGVEIGSLPDQEAVEAFVRPLDDTGISAAPDLIPRVIAEVEGYPYFIQIWGAELWEASELAGVEVLDCALLDQVEASIYERLDADFYEGRVESLTPAEQDVLMTAANCHYPPLKTVDIHSQSPKSQGNINVLMGRLSDEGVVFRVQKGIYEYTAPKFHEYLRRRRERLDKQGYDYPRPTVNPSTIYYGVPKAT
jgi:hypothetical protein